MIVYDQIADTIIAIGTINFCDYYSRIPLHGKSISVT